MARRHSESSHCICSPHVATSLNIVDQIRRRPLLFFGSPLLNEFFNVRGRRRVTSDVISESAAMMSILFVF
jgi:hypothetical protein